ncbi:MAG: PAS domain-containing sensor histidine kinase, partial [Kordiimonadaceae bacterium]|nr:PAS domain-containing sensor histidine kinase [Kordiimonadaceae bacterium]
MLHVKKNFLTAIIEATPNAIYLKDEDGKYIMINENGAKSVGKTVADFIGKDDTEIFSEDVGKCVMELDRKVFEGQSHSGEEKVEDGQVFISHKFLIEDEEGGGKALAGISTDITALKNTEKELSEAMRKAEEASEHKSVFLQNVSHELRTPLNAIIGFSSILSGEGGITPGKMDDNFVEYAKLINSSGVHLLAIINDLMDLSKVEAGEQEFDEEEIDVKYEVQSCIQTLRNMASEHNILIHEDFPDPDITLKGDERTLRQLIYNLLSNAVKYSTDDSEVTVKLRVRNSGGLDISIIDNGIGMSEDDLKTAMIPFRRAAQVKNSDITGTGLGLPL